MKRLLALALVACHAAEPPRPMPQPPPAVPDAAVAVVVPDAPPPPVVEVPPEPEIVTSVKDFTIVPAAPIAPIKTTAAYAKLGSPRIVRFAINVWAGWAPLVFANQGLAAKRIWKDAKGGDFQVWLVSLDDPTMLANSLAEGKLHVGWSTVDSLPLVAARLSDPRTRPRVVQQVDWSFGGDGVVVRDTIPDVAALRGQDIVLAQASPSHFMLLSLLADAGLTPADVRPTFVANAFEAAAAFHADPKYAAAVTWEPDVEILAKAPGSHLLVDTVAARRMIADVWFARSDFARDHPEIIEGLARGILDATDALADDANRSATANLLDSAFELPRGTAKAMFGDAHWTNYAENRAFFLDANNPTSFVHTYTRAQQLFLAAKVIDRAVPVDQLVDTTVVKRLAKRYPSSANTYEHHWAPPDADAFSKPSVLAHRVAITFFPNSSDLHKKVDNKLVDPDVDAKLEDIARVVAQFAGARIEIAGHSDTSMKGVADESLVRELSLHRAEAVRDELVKRFQLPADQLVARGYGWDKPADLADPDNHAKNRRIEIKVFPPP